MRGRRRWLNLATAFAGAAAAPRLGAQAPAARESQLPGSQPFPGDPHLHPPADPHYRMQFPRDFGAHAGFRTEWWYVTGWLDADRGFQVTFFRVRTSHPATNLSRFAPTQLLFAQAALMLPSNRHALHGQRAARIGSPATAFSERDTDLAIGDWTFSRGADDRYRTVIRDSGFSLDLVLTPPGESGQEVNRPWLQGEQGFSRKGPQPEQASHYYSRPQLRVSGSVNDRPVAGVAWFDHEWSTTVLDPSAAGWDWTGINLDDGSALVAFRIRRRTGDGNAGSPEPEPLWHYCAIRLPDGSSRTLDVVRFEVLRRWQSPRTMATYPVAMRLILPGRTLRLEPLFDDQEIDARQSTGTIYWEGAVRVTEEDRGANGDAGGGAGSSAGGRRAGLGYLELTGYHSPLKL